MKILRNSAKCAHCGVDIESTHVHDFKTHECKAAGLVARTFNHSTQEYEPGYPSFSVDGGRCYLRRLYTRKEDVIDTSIVEEETK
jgi:hypothetical protein